MGNLGFLNDVEKMRYCSLENNIDLDQYPAQRYMKVYKGADFLCYTYRSDGSLRVLNSFMVTDLSIHMDKGIVITWLDKRKYNIFTSTCISRKIQEYDVVGFVPFKNMVERTIKETRAGTYLYGLTSHFVCLMRSMPEDRVPYHTYIIPHKLHTKYFSEEELTAAVMREGDSW